MNFFRLRFLNTLLLFVAGIVLGFIIKERLHPAPQPQADYQPAAAQPRPDEPEEEVLEDEPEAEPEDRRPAAAPEPRYREPEREPRPEAPGMVIEPLAPAAKPGSPHPEDPEAFFSRPGDYAGKEVLLNLQMITAKRTGGAWRLNLVYSGPGKRMEYLYVQDTSVLGDAPELKIGYSYKVRFACSGSAESGNTLVSIEPTGEKAAWATGLSAVER